MPDFHDIIASLATGHSYQKHVVDGGEFANPRLGPTHNITSQDDFSRVIQDVVNDPNTKAFTNLKTNETIIYNAKDNVLIHLNASKDNLDVGTVYRPSGKQNKFRSSVAALSKNGDIIVEAKSPSEVRGAVDRFASTADQHFPKGGVVQKQINSSAVQDTKAKLEARTEVAQFSDADKTAFTNIETQAQRLVDAQKNVANVHQNIKAAAKANPNAITIANEGNALSVVAGNGDRYDVVKNAAGSADVTISDANGTVRQTINDMPADKTDALFKSAADQRVNSAIGTVKDALDPKKPNANPNMEVIADKNTILIDPNNNVDDTIEIFKNHDGKLTITVTGADGGIKANGVEIPKGYAADLGKHLRKPSLLSRFPELRKTALTVLAATVIGTGSVDAAEIKTPDILDNKVENYVEMPSAATHGDNVFQFEKPTTIDNIQSQILDKNTVFSMDANGNIADEIKLSNGSTLTTDMSPDGKTSNLLLTDAAGETKTIALGEDATSNLAALFQSDEFAKSHPDVAAQIEKNLNADFKGGITVNPERTTDLDFKGTFNKESGAADAVASKQPSAGIEPITKNGDEVLDAGKQAAALKKMNAVQEIAEAFKGVKTAKAAMTAAKGLSKGAKATVVGTLAGVGLATGAALLISKAHSAQRDAAEKLYENGGLTKEAYDEYVELNKQIEFGMQAENVVSQGPAVIFTTPALEYDAKVRFEAFSAKYGLSPTVHSTLGMSLFDGGSLSAEFAEEAIDIIPDKMADIDPDLHSLWRATQNLKDAESEESSATWATVGAAASASSSRGVMSISQIERLQELHQLKEDASEKVDQAKMTHAVEFSRTLNDPIAGEKLLSMMDKDVLMDMVEKTAAHHHEGQDPLITKLVNAQNAYDNAPYNRYNRELRNSLRQDLQDVKQEIRDNPDVLHGYIKDVFGDEGHIFSASENKLDPVEMNQVQNTVESMPQYIQERTIETIAADINQTGNTDGAHPYLRDIADLYKTRDAKHSSSSQREDLNEKIEELKTDILKNPEIIAEYTQTSPELKTFVDNYTQEKTSLDAYADVSDEEFSQAFDRIKQNALAKDDGEDVGNEHAFIKDLSEVYLEREEGWAIEIIDNPDRDRRIKELETKLRQNPEIISEYMDRKTGDDLISYEDPTDSPEYIEVANIMENVNAGEALDPVDEARVEEILNNPETEVALIDAVKDRYGETANAFINDTADSRSEVPHEVIQSQGNHLINMRMP